MQQIKFGWLIGLLLTTMLAHAQNNAIFKGGAGMGWQSAQPAVPATDGIFRGGNGDGWTKSGTTAPAVGSIFQGGQGDGWGSGANNRPLADSLFKGGAGDGWVSFSGGVPTLDSLFKGGAGDGWANQSKLPAIIDSIFRGGLGDGWASTFIPMSPLPVRLLRFTGEQRNGQHWLNWTTSLEINSSHFTVERQTAGSTGYEAIGRVAAAGNSTTGKDYTLIDTRPVMGNNIYRLQLVDLDGRFEYSNVVLLKLLKDQTAVRIYPNPTADLLQVSWDGPLHGKPVEMAIVDAAGKTVALRSFKKTQPTVAIPVQQLAAGMYLLVIRDQEEVTSVRFMKQ